MKKFFLLSLFVAACSLQLAAQEPTFVKGDKVVNLGIGFGSILYSGTYYSTVIPPVSASFEMGIADGIAEKGSIGVGGYLGISSYKWEYPYYYQGATWGYKYTNFILGARGVFHYPLVEKLDTYTGLMLGFNISTTKEFGTIDPLYTNNDSYGGLAYAWYVGGRYYFTESLAGMLELGYGISYLNLGVAFKL
ncbi:MAG: hypothetical protein GX587_15915 [Bacteroidales bacterium]|nr:hypothetical protein [Bacteroidales bacterium]